MFRRGVLTYEVTLRCLGELLLSGISQVRICWKKKESVHSSATYLEPAWPSGWLLLLLLLGLLLGMTNLAIASWRAPD